MCDCSNCTNKECGNEKIVADFGADTGKSIVEILEYDSVTNDISVKDEYDGKLLVIGTIKGDDLHNSLNSICNGISEEEQNGKDVVGISISPVTNKLIKDHFNIENDDYMFLGLLVEIDPELDEDSYDIILSCEEDDCCE